MVFIFLAILATIAVSSIVYAVIKIMQDSRLIEKLERSRNADKLLTLKEIRSCINQLTNDTTDSTTKERAITELRTLSKYIEKYY